MRIYFPAAVEDLIALRDRQPLNLSQGFAAIPEWVAVQDEQDAEVLEDYLLYAAADTSLALGDNRTGVYSRIVVVAELAEELVQALDIDEARVAFGSGAVSLAPKSVQAVFVDDQHARDLISKGESPEDESLSWFGPTEGQIILESLGR